MFQNHQFMAFGMFLDVGEPDDIRAILEAMRASTPHRTSNVIQLAGKSCPANPQHSIFELRCDEESVRLCPYELLYFKFDEDVVGFARYPDEIELGGKVVPVGFRKWTWMTRTDNSEPLNVMLGTAHSLGVDVLRYYRRDSIFRDRPKGKRRHPPGSRPREDESRVRKK